MKCPKCNTREECGNFCSNCGTQLKEQCSECEKMEKIGRIVCETKSREAILAKNNYGAYAIVFSTFLSYFGVALGICLLGMTSRYIATGNWANYTANEDYYMLTYILLGSFEGVISAILLMIFLIRMMRKRFSKKFPEYVEILRKVEKEEEI